MSRTNLDAATLAKSLRAMAGEGDLEWVCEPIRANELLDIADILDENAKLREDMEDMEGYDQMLRDERRQESELYVKAKVENEQLREQLAKARDPQRIGGTADPKSFVYAIEQLREFRWQHATNDEDAIPYINNVAAAHERETDELRKLAARLMGHIKHPPCEGCLAEMNCDCSDLTQCDEWSFMEADARKLGIEMG